MYARVLSGLSVIWVGAPTPSSTVSVIRSVDMSMTLTAPPRDPIGREDVSGAVGESEVADR